MSINHVRKAIIPCAGLGSRFLPTTKAIPKEMLPIIDKPAIQYVVEEGVKSGIENFILVSGKNKRAIEDYFDCSSELTAALKSKNKQYLISSISNLIEMAEFTYVRQREPLGLGHAVWSARHSVGKEHVAILLPDDIITGNNPGLAQLIKIAQQEKCNVVAVTEVPNDQISNYGVVAIRRQFSPNMFQIKDLVEKPKASQAPSNLAIIGRYVLSPTIFDSLGEVTAGSGEEIQLTDAIHNLIVRGEKVFAYKVQGKRYDTGTPLGWLKANISLALKHPDYSKEISQFLSSLDSDLIMMEGRVETLSKKIKEHYL